MLAAKYSLEEVSKTRSGNQCNVLGLMVHSSPQLLNSVLLLRPEMNKGTILFKLI